MTAIEENAEIVAYDIDNDIGILTISNGKQNTLREAEFLNLDSLKAWINNNDLKGLIITGKGRHFSSGADINNISAKKEDGSLVESLKKGKEILSYIESLPIITVAAISGACFGGGLEIALSCQFRIASQNSIFAFPESNIGIMPGLAGTFRLPKKVGRSKAIEIIISGRSISADEGYEIGLIDKVAPSKEHLSSALDFINELTENKSKDQIKSIITSINNAFSLDEKAAMDMEGSLFSNLAKNIKRD